MLAKIRQGLPFQAVEDLESAYGATRKEIGSVLAIPISTLSRRQKTGRLLVDESDRVARLAQIKDAVLAMMQGDAAIASVGDVWIENESSLLLQVPSAAVNGEYNYLLNPLYRDMGALIIGPIKPFGYDPRLVD